MVGLLIQPDVNILITDLYIPNGSMRQIDNEGGWMRGGGGEGGKPQD